MQADNHISKIEKISGLSNKEFYNTYVKKGLPVVVTDQSDWTSLEKFTPDYLKSNYSQVIKTVNDKTYTLPEIIELCKASTAQNKAPYPNMYDIKQSFPELLESIPHIKYGKSNRLYSKLLPKPLAIRNQQRLLFFGGEGCSFPTLHIDYHWVHTQLTQLVGEKDFILYPPNQTKYLYPDQVHNHFSAVNIIEPDYDKFPLFKNAKSLKITLKPGETIFIPSGWWHTTYIHNFNLTYSIDHVNAFNWNKYMDENYKSAKKHYPKFAWVILLYKKIMNPVFSIKEFLFNPIK